MNIICFMGGTCGDLVTSVIDPTDTEITPPAIKIDRRRSRMKNSDSFNSNFEKDQYIESMKKIYLSIPSHDPEYHIERDHSFILLTAKDREIALWAASRFINLHSITVWKHVQKICNISTVEDYARLVVLYSEHYEKYTDKTIDVREILNGNLIDKLSKYIPTTLNEGIYKRWLSLQDLSSLS